MTHSLDQIDYNIIEALQENARLSNKEIAARIHLSPSRCFERARRLRENGVLKGYHTHVAPDSIGVGAQALIAVRLREHSSLALESFEKRAQELEEIVGLCHVTGKTDYLVRVVVRDSAHLREITMDGIASWPEVAAVETHLILAETRRPLPILAREGDERRGAEGALSN